MEQNEFQELLLATAICAIACDGVIDDREITELRNMIDTTQYFKGINKLGFSEKMLMDVSSDGRNFIGNYFKRLEKVQLFPAQELLILEITLRIIQADDLLDENEIIFLKLVRSNLNVHDEIIIHRFGEVPFLSKGVDKQFITDRKNVISTISSKIEHATTIEDKFCKLFDEIKKKDDQDIEITQE